jgi:hypothetical protein
MENNFSVQDVYYFAETLTFCLLEKNLKSLLGEPVMK